MNISYFPRDGVYNQLLTTSSLELIIDRDLKAKLMYVYEHAFSRKDAVDNVIDEWVDGNMSDEVYDDWEIKIRKKRLEKR